MSLKCILFLISAGCDFVFDIKRTSREAYDHARRVLYQPVPLIGTEQESLISDKDSQDCDILAFSVEEKCQVCLNLEKKIN